MTSDEFIEWAVTRPKRGRYELFSGEIVAMAAERAVHARVKAAVWTALREAVRTKGLPCEVFMDGMAVEIDDETVYEPDAQLRCGEPLPDDEVWIKDPLIVVEVTSPSSGMRDEIKLEGYFRLPSLQHYLIVEPMKRIVVHHRREGDDRIQTAIVRTGELALDPPGITVSLPSFFE